jgi:predicted RNA polymerase sigma factor
VREQLLKLSKQLSPTQRKAFQLRDLDGLTTKETAHRLGGSASTVKAQVAGARLKLSQIIDAIPHRQRFQTISRSFSARRVRLVHADRVGQKKQEIWLS